MTMSPYDEAAWREILDWRQRDQGRSLVPRAARKALKAGRDWVGDGVRVVPGSAAVLGAVEVALGGLFGQVDRLSVATVRQHAILGRYTARGHKVGALADIRHLDLCDVDSVKPRVGLRYTLALMAEGAVAGAAMSGGEILATGGAVLGAGAGAAPGVGMLIAVTAADAVAILAACSRVTAEIGAYYGFDVELPQEGLHAAGIISVGLAPQGGKVTALQELNKLVQALTRRKSWQVLDQNVMTKIIRQVYLQLGGTISQHKLGQAVPVVGVAIGAGVNAKTMRAVADAAEHIYRERFLADKYGLEPDQPATNPPRRPPAGPPELAEALDIVGIVDAELERQEPDET